MWEAGKACFPHKLISAQVLSGGNQYWLYRSVTNVPDEYTTLNCTVHQCTIELGYYRKQTMAGL